MNLLDIITVLFEILGVVLVGGLVLLAVILVVFFIALVIKSFIKTLKKSEDKKDV